jgi:NAD(P)H-flavin reductase
VSPKTHEAILCAASRIGQRTRHFEFEVLGEEPFEFQPGQYIALDIEVEGRKHARYYSVASAPNHGRRFDLCLNVIPGGVVSPWLYSLLPGARILFSGPHGAFRLRQPVDPSTAFIATGTGIAPLRSMIHHLFCRPIAAEVTLLLGVRTEADILYRAEFERLARDNPGFRFIPTLSRPSPEWKGRRGYVQEHLASLFSGQNGFHAYICGLKNMVNEVCRRLEDLGCDRSAFSFEKYD